MLDPVLAFKYPIESAARQAGKRDYRCNEQNFWSRQVIFQKEDRRGMETNRLAPIEE